MLANTHWDEFNSDIYDNKSSKANLECKSIQKEPLCVIAIMRHSIWQFCFLYFLFVGEKGPSSFVLFQKNQHKCSFGFCFALSAGTIGVNLKPLLKQQNNSLCGSVWVCACMQPCLWPEDKFKENAYYQLQTRTAIRKGHPGVFVCCP